MRRADRILMYAFLIVGALLVVIPLGALLYGALQTTPPGAPGQAWTLAKFRTVFTTATYLNALKTTVLLSTTVAVVSTALATLLAWITSRTDTPGRPVMETLVLAPTFLSPLVGASGWIVLGAKNAGLINVYYRKLLGTTAPLVNVASFGGTIWVMVLFFVPVAYLYIVAALRSVDSSIEEAARLAGARTWRVMMGVTIPAVTPALLTGAIMVWVMSAEMYSIPAVLVGPGGLQPLAYRIFVSGRATPPDHPLAAAAGTLLILLTLLMLFAYRLTTRIEGRFVTMGGKGSKPRIVRLGPWRWATFTFGWLYLIAAVFLPYTGLVVGSFQRFFGAPLSSLTINHWKAFFRAAEWKSAIETSLLVGVITATIVVVLGAVTGYAITRKKVRQSGALDYLLSLPMGIPGIAFGIGMVWAYVRTPLYGTVLILAIALIARNMPSGLRGTSTGLLQISTNLEEGAALAGASAGRVLWDITLPLLKPMLFSAWALTLLTVLREVSVSIILYTPKTMPISVLAWDYLEQSSYANACITGLIQTVLVLIILVLARVLFKVRLSSDSPV